MKIRKNKPWTGKFIVLDGPDGCGKTTQLRRLGKYISSRGVEVVQTRDPGGTAVGDRIRRMLLDKRSGHIEPSCEVLLFMASRAQLFHEVILPAKKAQACILCDRWIYSTCAYQGGGGQFSTERIMALAEAAQIGWPDAAVLIDLPAEAGLDRLDGPPDRMETKPLAYHRRVRRHYRQLPAIRPEARLVDGRGDPERVQQRILKVICEVIGSS